MTSVKLQTAKKSLTLISNTTKKYNLKEGEKLVVTHEVFNDEKYEDKYADHFDLNNEKQTIRPKKVETEQEKAATPAASTLKSQYRKQEAITLFKSSFQQFLSK